MHVPEFCACPKPFTVFPSFCERCGFPSLIRLKGCVFCRSKRLPYHSGLSCGIFLSQGRKVLFARENALLCRIAAARLKEIAKGNERMLVIYKDGLLLKRFLDSIDAEGMDFHVRKLSGTGRFYKKACELAVLFVPFVLRIEELRKQCLILKKDLRVRKIVLAALLFGRMFSFKC